MTGVVYSAQRDSVERLGFRCVSRLHVAAVLGGAQRRIVHSRFLGRVGTIDLRLGVAALRSGAFEESETPPKRHQRPTDAGGRLRQPDSQTPRGGDRETARRDFAGRTGLSRSLEPVRDDGPALYPPDQRNGDGPAASDGDHPLYAGPPVPPYMDERLAPQRRGSVVAWRFHRSLRGRYAGGRHGWN